MLQTIELFDFHFLGYVCGLSSLGGHRITKAEKISVQLIVLVIPEKEFTDTISKCPFRDWHSIHPIMNFIERYDLDKAKRIIDLIDMNSFEEKVKESWGNDHEITELCDILYIGNYKVARLIIDSNIDNNSYSVFFFCNDVAWNCYMSI